MRNRALVAPLMVLVASCGGMAALDGAATPAPDELTTPSDVVTQTAPYAATETIVVAPTTFDEALMAAESSGEVGRIETAVGGVDMAAARAITDELVRSGVDLTGIELWIFDVAGSDDRLVVVEAGAAAENLADDVAGQEFIAALLATDALASSGGTRFVMNYRDTDEEGPFTFTMTMPLDAMVDAVASGTPVDSDLVDIQFVRTDQSTTGTPTDVPNTTEPPGNVLLVDRFEGSTTATPLFGPDIVTTAIVDDLALRVTAFAPGVIPVMYPEALPNRASISFDVAPVSADAGAAFGAVVLADDPADGALEHYVTVLAYPIARQLTVLPFDAQTGGWGTPQTTPIPPDAGFAVESWSTMQVDLADGAVSVSINDIAITTWTGSTPVNTGYWGPTILGSVPGDEMLVSLVLVEALP